MSYLRNVCCLINIKCRLHAFCLKRKFPNPILNSNAIKASTTFFNFSRGAEVDFNAFRRNQKGKLSRFHITFWYLLELKLRTGINSPLPIKNNIICGRDSHSPWWMRCFLKQLRIIRNLIVNQQKKNKYKRKKKQNFYQTSPYVHEKKQIIYIPKKGYPVIVSGSVIYKKRVININRASRMSVVFPRGGRS